MIDGLAETEGETDVDGDADADAAELALGVVSGEEVLLGRRNGVLVARMANPEYDRAIDEPGAYEKRRMGLSEPRAKKNQTRKKHRTGKGSEIASSALYDASTSRMRDALESHSISLTVHPSLATSK